MNEHISEKFGRSRPKNGANYGGEDADDESRYRLQFSPSPAIRQYFSDFIQLSTTDGWLSLPEIPTADELLHPVGDRIDQSFLTAASTVVEPNRVSGSWSSKTDYLKAQYLFCREESTFALRSAIALVRACPGAKEPDLRDECSGIGIYDKAHVTGIFFAPGRGIATRMSFSTERSQVNINWRSSQRLLAGSLIVIVPSNDTSHTPGGKIVPGVIAARPFSLLERQPPEIDIFFPYDAVIDPLTEYTIVEETNGFFEAQRYNLLALQKMTQETFPLSEYLIEPELHRTVGIVDNVQHMDITPALGIAINPLNGCDYTNIDVRSDWTRHKFPRAYSSRLDQSQMEALKQMLTRCMSMIQGPPGTGKTHVSVAALMVLLKQMKLGDPPIIVACQTNHALDQLLRHVALFELNFVRIGGRTADNGVIKDRTLYEIRQQLDVGHHSRSGNIARRKAKTLRKDLMTLLQPLNPEEGFFDHHVFKKYGVITDEQFESIQCIDQDFIASDTNNNSSDSPPNGPMSSWLQHKMHLSSSTTFTPESLSFENVEEDFDDEIPIEAAAEKAAQQDAIDSLNGDFLQLGQKWTINTTLNTTDKKKLPPLLKSKKSSDLRKVRPDLRGKIYLAMVEQCKKNMAAIFVEKMKEYNKLAKEKHIGNLEADLSIVKNAKLIGLTTTGLSKNRALISATQAKIVMLEEAGESLECTVAPAFMPSIEQVIQVGDHKQLQPRPQKREHDQMGWGISLFERLINNKVETRMLCKQRRMRAEISRLLRPVYGPELENFDITDTRAAVPGMGDFNTWFMDHRSRETKDALKSTLNEEEAELVAEFVAYLILNGTRANKISVLTFYKGQKRRLQRCLRDHPLLHEMNVAVYTVDSYQGEENDVIILSLVRSNDAGVVGFASNPNRINVALSRARQGLYMFGNRSMLEHRGGDLWKAIFEILDDRGDYDTRFSEIFNPDDRPELRIGAFMPLVCGCGVPTHETDNLACQQQCNRSHMPRTTYIESADQFRKLDGGCMIRCEEKLSCGHMCPYRCHPTSHNEIMCQSQCRREMPCGHHCLRLCFDPCACDTCTPVQQQDTSVPIASEVVGASRCQASTAASHGDITRQPLTLLPTVLFPHLVSQSDPELLPPVRTTSKYDYGRAELDETVHQRGANYIISEESSPTRPSSKKSRKKSRQKSRRSDVLVDLNDPVKDAELGPRVAISMQAPVDLSIKVVEDLIDLTD